MSSMWVQKKLRLIYLLKGLGPAAPNQILLESRRGTSFCTLDRAHFAKTRREKF